MLTVQHKEKMLSSAYILDHMKVHSQGSTMSVSSAAKVLVRFIQWWLLWQAWWSRLSHSTGLYLSIPVSPESLSFQPW